MPTLKTKHIDSLITRAASIDARREKMKFLSILTETDIPLP